ncbi:MAG: hypothetical protein ACXV5U_09740 [Ilumatobacteraceae bacterium]
MSATEPSISPWPAPNPADAATPPPAPTRRSGLHQLAAGVLEAARRVLDPEVRAEHLAVKEEQRITDELGELPCGWFVSALADIEVLDGQAGSLDRLVVGPGGVFIIRPQRQPAAQIWVSERTMTIEGRAGEQFDEARAEARRASDRLSQACGFDVTVQSVLVMIGAVVHTVSRPAEVHVRDQHDLRDWLCMQPVRLDGDTVGAIDQRVSRRRSVVGS